MYTLSFHKIATFKLLLAFVLVAGVGSLSDRPTGVIYDSEDKSGKSVDYFYYSQEFANVQELIDNHILERVALLCVRGVYVKHFVIIIHYY